MKCFFASFMILCCSFAAAQLPDTRVEISPASPMIGSRVAVVYHAASAPAFAKNAGELSLEILVVPEGKAADPKLRQLPMTRNGDDWRATYSADEAGTALLCFRFVAGDSVDDNGENAWAVMICDAALKPVRGAHVAMASMYQYGIGSFRKGRDSDLMKEELRKELSSYPDNWDAASTLWSVELSKQPSDSLKSLLRAELDKFYERGKTDDAQLARYPSWYERLGDSTKAQMIRSEGSARSPGGRVALEARMTALRGVDDPVKIVGILQQVMADFPSMDKSALQANLATLHRNALKAPDFNAALDALGRMPEPQYFHYTQLAKKLAAAGERLAEAERLAKRAVEMTGNPKDEDRPYYKTAKEWMESARYEQSSALQSYAAVLMKGGKFDSAVEPLGKAYAMTKGEDPEIDQLYVQALSGGKQFDKALEIGLTAYAQAKGTDSLVADLKSAFAGKDGDQAFASLPEGRRKEFDRLLAKAHDDMVAGIRKKVLESRINQPSVDFTLNDLNGKPVSLASLKGNVVVLDFWATWCGPCKMSFPFLKKVYERFRANPRVTILAVDCWERLKDYAATVENAKKFQSDNGYEWTVLVDGTNEVVEQYGVDGIPTKFVLGKDGAVAFKGIGFAGPEMEEELSQQIEILLAEPDLGMN